MLIIQSAHSKTSQSKILAADDVLQAYYGPHHIKAVLAHCISMSETLAKTS
jgi:hypothetical protein